MLRAVEQRFNRYYELKSLGYDLKAVEKKVCEIYGIEREEIYTGGRQKRLAEARGLFCCWAARELGYELTDLARRLGMTEPGVGYAGRRGERIMKENNHRLQS